MKYSNYLIAVVATLSILSSCEKFGAMTPDSIQVSLFPGECMTGNLTLCDSYKENGGAILSADGDMHSGLEIGFEINMAVQTDVVERINLIGPVSVYRQIPTDKVYNQFGDNSKNVQKGYEDIYAAYSEVCGVGKEKGLTSTIYYTDGMVLTADKDFAGIKAGENLASIVHGFGSEDYWQKAPIPGISVPSNYYPLLQYIAIKFYDEGFDVVTEQVAMHLEIPVKVGMLLTLINDRLNDSEAEMQFRDEILTCDFTISKNLK